MECTHPAGPATGTLAPGTPATTAHGLDISVMGHLYRVRFWTDSEWAAEPDPPSGAYRLEGGGVAHFAPRDPFAPHDPSLDALAAAAIAEAEGR